MKKTLTAAAVSSALVLGLATSAMAIHDSATAETATVVKGTSKITIDGSVRERGFYRKDNTTGPGDNDRSATGYDSRIQLGVNAKVSDTATGYMQLESQGGNGTTDVDAWGNPSVDPGYLFNGGDKLASPTILQAWINYQPSSWGVKAGHMPLALGNKVFFDHTGSGDDAIVAYANLGDATHIAALAIKFDENAGNDNSDDLDGYVGLVTHKVSDSLNLGLNVTYLQGGDANLGSSTAQDLASLRGPLSGSAVVNPQVVGLPGDPAGWTQTITTTAEYKSQTPKPGDNNFTPAVSTTTVNTVNGNGNWSQTVTRMDGAVKTVANSTYNNTTKTVTTVTTSYAAPDQPVVTNNVVTNYNTNETVVTTYNNNGVQTNQRRTSTTFYAGGGAATTPWGVTPLVQPAAITSGTFALPTSAALAAGNTYVNANGVVVASPVVATAPVAGQTTLTSTPNPFGPVFTTTLGQDPAAAAAGEQWAGLSMTNVGLTADGKIGAISYMADLEMQFGTFAESNFGPTSDANGWAMKLGADYDLGVGKVGLLFGHGSGDEYGSDADMDQFINFLTDTTYDTIVAGYRGVIPTSFNGGLNSGLSNLNLYQLKGSAKTVCPMTGKDLSLFGSLSYMRLAEDRVLWSTDGVNMYRLSDDEVGTELDFIATWALSAGLNYKVEAGYLFTGDAYKTAAVGPGSDPDNEVFLRHSLDLKF